MPRRMVEGATPDTSRWPAGVRQITIDETGWLGLDDEGRLYWDGNPVEVGRRLTLSRWQKAGAITVAIAAVLGGFGGFVQGAIAGHEYGCEKKWLQAGCDSGHTPPL